MKKGAIGTYTAAHKAEWEAVIGADGKWNGLIMAANKPVLGNGGCNVQAGEFTLTWANDDAPMPSGLTYEIRRGFSGDYGASEVITNGYGGLSFVDRDFYTTGGVSRIWYWVRPEHQLFEASEPIVTRTRHAILVGLGEWDESVYGKNGLKDTGGGKNVGRFEEVAISLGGFDAADIHKCVNSGAKTNDVHREFVDVANSAAPGDICVFYISTHGGILDNGTSCLALYDGDYTEMQLAQDIALLEAESKGLAVVGIVSACHSGALFDNPDQSVSRTSWYLRNGLAQCSANVAWVTSSGAATTSYDVFNDFMLDYGWEKGWGQKNGQMTFLDLAEYTKRQYDGLFYGIAMKNESETKQVQIDNRPLLSKVMVRSDGAPGNQAQELPCQFGVGATTNKREKIVVSWDAATNADTYYVFYSTTGWYAGLKSVGKTLDCCEFKIVENTSNPQQKQLNDFLLDSVTHPMYFIVKAVNGAGIRQGTPKDDPRYEEVAGWIDDSHVITFSTIGIIDEPEGWYGVYPEFKAGVVVGQESSSYMEKPFPRGTSFTIGKLPSVSREGFVCTGWFDQNKKRLETNTTVSSSVKYKAEWTAMTTNFLNQHPLIAIASNSDIATAAAMPAANGRRTVGECYTLGIDPEDPDDDLRITHFQMEGGKPVITLNHTEDGSGNSFAQRVKTLGKANLSDAEWREVPEGGDASLRFFTVVDRPFPAAGENLVGKEAHDRRVHAGVGFVRQALENDGHFVWNVANRNCLHGLPPSTGCNVMSNPASIIACRMIPCNAHFAQPGRVWASCPSELKTAVTIQGLWSMALAMRFVSRQVAVSLPEASRAPFPTEPSNRRACIHGQSCCETPPSCTIQLRGADLSCLRTPCARLRR